MFNIAKKNIATYIHQAIIPPRPKKSISLVPSDHSLHGNIPRCWEVLVSRCHRRVQVPTLQHFFCVGPVLTQPHRGKVTPPQFGQHMVTAIVNFTHVDWMITSLSSQARDSENGWKNRERFKTKIWRQPENAEMSNFWHNGRQSACIISYIISAHSQNINNHIVSCSIIWCHIVQYLVWWVEDHKHSISLKACVDENPPQAPAPPILPGCVSNLYDKTGQKKTGLNKNKLKACK